MIATFDQIMVGDSFIVPFKSGKTEFFFYDGLSWWHKCMHLRVRIPEDKMKKFCEGKSIFIFANHVIEKPI